MAGSHRRRLLALLAGRAGRSVSVDVIVDALWGDDPPPSAGKTIQSHVMRLRRSLADVGSEVLETVPSGYRLNVDPAAVDAERFVQIGGGGSPGARPGPCGGGDGDVVGGPRTVARPGLCRVPRRRVRRRRGRPPRRAAAGRDGGSGGGPALDGDDRDRRRRTGTARRRGSRPGAGVGLADAGVVRRWPPAARAGRLPAGASCACRAVRSRARRRAARPGAQDPRSGSGAAGRRRALAAPVGVALLVAVRRADR